VFVCKSSESDDDLVCDEVRRGVELRFTVTVLTRVEESKSLRNGSHSTAKGQLVFSVIFWDAVKCQGARQPGIARGWIISELGYSR
jgi:hypothetical protein